MSPSPDPAVSNLSYNLLQRHNTPGTLPPPQARRHNKQSRHDRGRGDRPSADRPTRIYPQDIANSPSSAKRFPSSSASPPQYHATTSPLLSALGATTSPAQYTREWTKSLPFPMNQPSPGSGPLALNGSPPAFQISPSQRGPSAPSAMSNSPSARGMRPLSHPNNHTSFGGRLHSPSQNSPSHDRRASMYSQTGARAPFASNPPLPHQPQEHYYNLPGLDLGLRGGSSHGITPGEGGYYCGFDTLALAGDEPAKGAENVLVVGFQGGIDVFRVERSRMDILGRLEGLKGSVIGARILPWTARSDPFSASRPLIALVIHGPATESSSRSSSVVDDSRSDPPSRPASITGNDSASKVIGYRTTVEVYSLKARQRIAVLYKGPLIPASHPVDSPFFEVPPPVGDLIIDAKGKFVVVASGASGEVFVFAPYASDAEFRCIGKLWTAVSFRERTNQSTSTSTAGSHDDLAPDTYGVPIFSLSHRWLAVAPPDSTVLLPVNGVALTSGRHAKPPGLSQHTVPPQPTANCIVDAPESGSLLDWLTREGAQSVMKGARWATEMGMQAVKNYMNRPQANGLQNDVYGVEPQPPTYFPPTHGYNHAQPRQEATVVSLYDLDRLVDAEGTKAKNALHPFATMPASLGCSFLSFTPTGLMLMSVSAKGDFQDVWDLKRCINFRRTRKTAKDQLSGPHVRQVARFARITVTSVVDVVWSGPRHDRVAVVTDKGTVHMFSMPASAFQWPPPRRVRKVEKPAKSKEETNTSPGRAGALGSAMQALNGTAKPFIDAVRARNSSGGSRFPSLGILGITPAAGAKSGKAVAANVGKSISNIRHAGDNKLTLTTSPSGVKPNSVRWLTGKNRGSIALVNGGTLQIYRVHMRPATGRGKPARISKKILVKYRLEPVPDSRLAPAATEELVRQPGEPETVDEIHGEWLPRALPIRRAKPAVSGTKELISSLAPLSFSEIETNPPYQPFHTDRRATRFVFTEASPASHKSHGELDLPIAEEPQNPTNLLHLDDESTWLFGENMAVVRIVSQAMQHYDSDEDIAAQIENKLSLRDGNTETEQIIVTTKRRRHMVDDADEEGFFEDDCDVLDFAEDRV